MRYLHIHDRYAVSKNLYLILPVRSLLLAWRRKKENWFLTAQRDNLKNVNDAGELRHFPRRIIARILHRGCTVTSFVYVRFGAVGADAKYVDPFICRWMTATGKIANNGLRLSLHHRNVGYVAKRAKICIRERRRCGELSVRVLFYRRHAILTELWNGRLNLAWSWDQDIMRRLYYIEYNWTPSLVHHFFPIFLTLLLRIFSWILN